MSPRRKDITSLAELLQVRAAAAPERLGFIYLADGKADERRLTYGELDAAARALAVRLAERARPGDRAILYYPAGLEFLTAFFACAYAGVIAVPAASPRAGGHALEPLAAMAADCAPRIVLTDAETLRARGAPLPDLGAEWLASDAPADAAAASAELPLPDPDGLAYLQYTSGSTTAPRGVMVGQRNVMANLEAVRGTIRQGRDGICVTWLPHFHDMGLGGLLGALYGDYLCVYMSPLAFMARPLRWLRAITRYRGTWSGAPNFAFDLCSRRVRESDLAQLDLGSWQVVANGSEPVRRDTIERFVETFAPVGFRREAMMPPYGLAEAVVFVSGTPERRAPLYAPIEADGLRAGRAEGAMDPDKTIWQVACGRPARRHGFRIVDPETRRLCAPGQVGEIWISGPSVAEGYWNRPEETREAFHAELEDAGAAVGRYLRSGDLGFAWQGQICITDRLKDVIIVAGANHYPRDIEASVEACHPAVRRNGVAAFAVSGANDRLVVAAEVNPNLAEDAAEQVIAAARAAVAEGHQVTLDAVCLLKPHGVLKTSSGKIKRAAMRERWLADALDPVAAWRSPRCSARVAAPAAARSAAAETAERIERRILDSLRRLLGEPDRVIDPEQPIDRIGLGSIELADLAFELEDIFAVRVPLGPLLSGQNPRQLAAAIAAGADTEAAAPRATDARAHRGIHPFETVINPELGGLLRSLKLDKRYLRGEGAWLWDASGRRYLDALAGYGAVPFGHNPPEIWAAVEETYRRREPGMSQPSLLEAAGRLAEALIAHAPQGLERATFTNSGAETVEAALKLARAATGRRKVLSTHDGFHGKTLGALSVTGRRDYQAAFAVPRADVAYVGFGDAAALESLLAERGAEFAAFIVEPIQGEGGMVEAPAGYLRRAAELCRRHGVKLVVDEIQTGLGRTGRLFACDAEGVSPDMLLLAKALGGGLVPIGAVLYRADCASETFARRHSSTFAGNSLACRVGLAVLERLTAEDAALPRQVARLGQGLRDGLGAVAARHAKVLRRVRGRGYMLGLEFSDRRADYGGQGLLGVLAEQGHLAALVASYLLDAEGLRVAPTLLAGQVLRIEPPLTFTAAQCSRVVEAVEAAVGHVAAADTGALTAHLLEPPRAPRPVPGAVARRAAPPAKARARRPGESTWAFLAHPIDAASFTDFDPGLAGFDAAAVTELTTRLADIMEPFVAGRARVEGAEGQSAYGEFIVVPQDSRRLARKPQGAALGQVARAVELARRRGARLVGLGGFLSIASGGGRDLADPGVSLTAGSGLTAVSAFDAAAHALDRAGLGLDEASVGVIGAAGSVGQALAFLLAERVQRLLLLGNPHHPEANLRRLLKLARGLVEAILGVASSPARCGPIAARARVLASRNGGDPAAIASALLDEGWLAVSVQPATALPECDAVITATSDPDQIVTATQLKPGAIACDLSRPRNIGAEVHAVRGDVLVLDGGLMRPPPGTELGWHFGLPPGLAYACMCEVMLLALEGWDAPAAGAVPDPARLHRLRARARHHGFVTAATVSFGRAVPVARWDALRAARHGTIRPPADDLDLLRNSG